jgi:ribokinase
MKRLNLDSANHFLDLGPEIVTVINKTDKSSVIKTKAFTERIPSIVRKIRDPTGASDGYVGAFLSAYLKGYDLKTCGVLGSVEASFVSENFGSQTNLPDWESLRDRCRKRFKGFSFIFSKTR